MATSADPSPRLADPRPRRPGDDSKTRRARRAEESRSGGAGGSVAGIVAAFALALVAFGAGAGLAPWIQGRMGLNRPPAQGAVPPTVELTPGALAALEQWLAPAPAPAPAPALVPAPEPGPFEAPGAGAFALDAGLTGRLERLEAELARQGAADALAETRLAEFAERLALLDPGGGGPAAAALRVQELFALVLARRQLDEGRPLAVTENVLRQLFAARDPAAVEALAAWTRAPVSRDQLAQRLGRLAAEPAPAPAVEGGWLARTRAALGGLVLVRRTHDTTDANPAVRQLALDALAEGDLARAIALFADRPRSARLDTWVADARRLRAAEDGLARLESVTLQLGLQDHPAPPGSAPAPGAQVAL